MLAILPQPLGKILIKKSFETNDTSLEYQYRYIGNGLLIFVMPATHCLAYYYGENAFIAPVVASGVLLNIVLARYFLKEGKSMNTFTITGITIFVIGLFSILWAYGTLLSVDDNLNDNIEWGVFSIYLGLWVWGLTVLTCVVLFSHIRELFAWSAVAALLTSLDVVGTYDKWIFNNAFDSTSEIAKGVLASMLYIGASLLSIFIVNILLSNPQNPAHIVATIISSIALGLDVFADMFIYQRYTAWGTADWALSITGLVLMVMGIWFMNLHWAPRQQKLMPLQKEDCCDVDKEVNNDEGQLLIELTKDGISVHQTKK